jgi:hypothetical protein
VALPANSLGGLFKLLRFPGAIRAVLRYDSLMGDSERPGVSFLLIDLDLANTFVDIANTSGRDDVCQRNIANAWKAHDSIEHLAAKGGLTDSELATIVNGLRALRKRLAGMKNPYPS